MSIQIIHHKYDLFGIRIHNIYKIFDLLCPVNSCTMFPDTYMMNTTERFHKSK